jgi:hypothetical protein
MFDEKLLPFIANLSSTIMWIALTVGLLLFVIGYFAGGKMAIGRIGICVILVTVISVLALPAPMKLYTLVQKGLDVTTVFVGTANDDTTKTSSRTQTSTAANNRVVYETAPVSLQLFTLVLYILWNAFIISMGIFLYETLTVTAEEAEKH